MEIYQILFLHPGIDVFCVVSMSSGATYLPKHSDHA